METFQRLESEVRGYCRNWPVVFDKAVGSHVYDETGKPYLDFFAGAGSLNYGHNNPKLKTKLIEYLTDDRIVHSLDAYSVAKRDFLKTFEEIVLKPRDLDYKIQFPGPAGNNAVEAALKLARKYTGRETIINFTNGFHGMTLGALAVTGNSMKRGGAGVPLDHVATMPFDNYLDGQTPDFLWLRTLLEDSGSGLDKPAAVIVEAIQGEGGINVASATWLRGLSEVCREYDMLLIVDDIQMGCGRTGDFFSFEEAGITPDIVTLSKSISGYGLPMALTLFKRELDVWEPGEHNGTFRGFNPAMVTGSEALRQFWSDDEFATATKAKGDMVAARLGEMAAEFPEVGAHVRGRGLARGLAFEDTGIAKRLAAESFDRGLLVETSGPEDEVAKLLPPLTATEEELTAGLDIMADAARAAVKVAQPA
ncbi:diaminobutyrate--2-oxoglutarate transaminase [Nocardiopsis sp. NRRL B-16309]|uniref:diaminobutyrate--2-oxoglutarate transaminase n=1 Tax=Nocardiopsis sp. NRRL B-16309 TaxID=1519494 RepID=UPI0006AE3782|nr:diaminobutyrate--2-oxoglutarate transaminase [Nocardiopsis sp. NRRL B-16309]KOX17736.1 diaminobutyrate--2-oxoglutarate aminotransferase [Nocardiopsis sp. NRRL B-16309]